MSPAAKRYRLPRIRSPLDVRAETGGMSLEHALLIYLMLCSSVHQCASHRVHHTLAQVPKRGRRTTDAWKNKRIRIRHRLDQERLNAGGERLIDHLDEFIRHDGVARIRGVDSVEREYPAEKISCQRLAMRDD